MTFLLFFKIYKRLREVKIWVCSSPRLLTRFLWAYSWTLISAKYWSQNNLENIRKSQQLFQNENNFNEHLFLSLIKEFCFYVALCILLRMTQNYQLKIWYFSKSCSSLLIRNDQRIIRGTSQIKKSPKKQNFSHAPP